MLDLPPRCQSPTGVWNILSKGPSMPTVTAWGEGQKYITVHMFILCQIFLWKPTFKHMTDILEDLIHEMEGHPRIPLEKGPWQLVEIPLSHQPENSPFQCRILHEFVWEMSKFISHIHVLQLRIRVVWNLCQALYRLFMEVIVRIASWLISSNFHLSRGLTTYLYWGYNPFIY